MSSELIIFISLLLCMGFVFAAVGDVVLGAGRRKKKRVRDLCQRLGTHQPDLHAQISLLADDPNGKNGLDKLIRNYLPNAAVLSQRLARAGVAMGVSRFMMLVGVFGLLVFFALKVLVGLNIVLAVLSGISAAFATMQFVLGILTAKRNAAFTTRFPEAIDLIVRAVKSGLPVSEGIMIVAKEIDGPVATEFRKISEAMKIGQTMEDSLWAASKRMDNAEFNFFVISLVVQSETGGNLAETLENLSEILRQRQQMKLKIHALASEARASAYILGGLPFIMVGILEVMSPGYTAPLFNHPVGIGLTTLCLLSICLAVAIMYKMVRFEI